METSKQNREKSVKQGLSLTQFYLILYNFVSAVGWLVILVLTYQTIRTYKSDKDLYTARDLYRNVGFWLRIFQTLSVLEVFHALFGFVRSNAFLTLLQITSRLVVLWAIIDRFEPSKKSLGVLIICLAWSITEVVRYSYYAFNILDFVPYFMTWCRYSLFIVLYPLGVAGELTCVYYAIQHVIPIKNRNQYSFRLPNELNFSFDALIVLCLLIVPYIPGFPLLYGHMLSQRKKMLSPKQKTQ